MGDKNLEYQVFQKDVMPGDIASVVCEINNSKDFELDELSHIVLKGTNTRVGYIGDDTFEIINPHKKEFVGYHAELKNIFNYFLINYN